MLTLLRFSVFIFLWSRDTLNGHESVKQVMKQYYIFFHYKFLK